MAAADTQIQKDEQRTKSESVHGAINLKAKPSMLEPQIPDDDWRLSNLALVVVNNRRILTLAESYKSRIVSINVELFPQGVKHQETLDAPFSMAVLNSNEVVATVPDENQIVVVEVHPELRIKKTVSTQKSYYGVAVLDESTLVVGAVEPPEVDIVDMEGKITRTLSFPPSVQDQLVSPCNIHVSRQGNIIISDMIANSLFSVTQSGEVNFFLELPGDPGPAGVTTTEEGDILVALSASNQVIRLSECGEMVGDILTSEDGLEDPVGIAVDGDTLFVATEYEGVKMFAFK